MSPLAAMLCLRLAEPADASRLARLADHTGGSWTEAGFAASLSGSARGWVIDAPGAVPFGELHAGDALRPAIAAAILVQPGPDDWEVLDLAVAPACQRQGLARRLLAHVKAMASNAGAERLLLEVRAGNQRAQSVYAAAGFCQLALRPGYYSARAARPADDAVVLACPL